MSLVQFKKEYVLRYQDILQKSLVGLKIANTRFQGGMKFGDTVTRFILDLSGVRVRPFTNLVDQTIDPVADSAQNMVINYQVGAVFPIARLEKIQAGPLDPAMTAGKNIALKVKMHVDASILYECVNAFATFDTGNLTTSSANGTPIALSTTNLPQLMTNSYARLFSNNAEMSNLCYVFDAYSAAIVAQHPIGKNTVLGDNTFKNGFSGPVFGAEMYVSNNLTGEITLAFPTIAAAGETVTILGVVFTYVSSIGATPGNVLVGAAAANSQANLIAAINGAAGAGTTYVELSAANRAILSNARVVATAVSTSIKIQAIGYGRITASETLAGAGNVFGTGFVHCYYGQKGAIDVVIQDQPEMEMRDEPKQLTTNIFNNVVYAVKTFTDGAQYFLDLWIQ